MKKMTMEQFYDVCVIAWYDYSQGVSLKEIAADIQSNKYTPSTYGFSDYAKAFGFRTAADVVKYGGQLEGDISACDMRGLFVGL